MIIGQGVGRLFFSSISDRYSVLSRYHIFCIFMPSHFSKPMSFNLGTLIDVSAVRADSTEQEVRQAFLIAIQYRCAAVFSLPCFTPLLRDLLKGESLNGKGPALGGAIGFPGGGETTTMKVAQARELTALGCGEIDMVINVNFLKSGLYRQVRDDIRSVKQAVGNIPLKVILECHYLTEDEICKASELAVEAGADWIKTSTGWAPTGATFKNIILIRNIVGNSAKIKAAGGVRDLETLQKMADLGVERFGIGGKTVLSILDEHTIVSKIKKASLR